MWLITSKSPPRTKHHVINWILYWYRIKFNDHLTQCGHHWNSVWSRVPVAQDVTLLYTQCSEGALTYAVLYGQLFQPPLLIYICNWRRPTWTSYMSNTVRSRWDWTGHITTIQQMDGYHSNWERNVHWCTEDFAYVEAHFYSSCVYVADRSHLQKSSMYLPVQTVFAGDACLLACLFLSLHLPTHDEGWTGGHRYVCLQCVLFPVCVCKHYMCIYFIAPESW